MFRGNSLRASLLACVVIACCVSGGAQTPENNSKRATIEELLKVINATQTAKSIFVTLIGQYSQALAQDSIDTFEKRYSSPEVKEKMRGLIAEFYSRLSQRIAEEVPERINYDLTLTRLYVEVYDQEFSESELRELLTFFKEPIGQKFLSFGPRVSTILRQKAEAEFGQTIIETTRQIVSQEVKRLEERSAAEFKPVSGKKRH